MISFMNEDFLLKTETAKTLYHKYASVMPVVDYHCHINPEEIAKDISFSNITKVWLGGDHYKWRLMRSNGIDESLITGDAPDKDKFFAWAKTLEKAIGNPLYHWSHLELKRYFDYHGILNESTASEVWDLCNEKLQDSSMSVRGIIKKSNVKVICTTDDPVDTLEWHSIISKDATFDVKVLPAFRPDKAMNMEKVDYLKYIARLSDVSNIEINSFSELCEAIEKRIVYFHENGCLVSDHGLDYVMYEPATEEVIEQIFQKRLHNESITKQELLQFKTAFLLFVGKLYHKFNWVMQLHYGARRDNNTYMFEQLGPDTGYDSIDSYTPSASLSAFLNALNQSNQLPKTIIYSLNPVDNAVIDTIIGCFQDSSAVGKIQHGSAWWFNDHKVGMTEQMTSLANLGLLANFNGMLTDSRSFLSYTRHEYFRRILCDLIGNWVEQGEYPNEIDYLGNMVQDISYYNAMRYFNF